MGSLKEAYRDAPVKHADETGWRNDGHSGYAWLFCTRLLSIFLFKNTRSASVPKGIFGEEKLPGVLVVDRYNAYNKAPVAIQYCYAHLLRDVEKLGKDHPDDEEVAPSRARSFLFSHRPCTLRRRISPTRSTTGRPTN